MLRERYCTANPRNITVSCYMLNCVPPNNASECDQKVSTDVIRYEEVTLEESAPFVQYHWCPYKKRRRH